MFRVHIISLPFTFSDTVINFWRRFNVNQSVRLQPLQMEEDDQNISKSLTRRTKSSSCLICAKTFKYASALKKHKNVHFTTTFLHKCDLCVYEAKNKSQVTRHKQAEHEENVKCLYCSFESTTKYSLKQHVQAQHQEAKFVCKLCDFKTSYKSSLTDHVNSVHKGMKVKCTTCEWTGSRNNLSNCS